MTEHNTGPFIRSWLIAPADVQRRASRALQGEADAGILDLEDAVPQAAKAEARQRARERLCEPRTALGYVRVNAFDAGCFHDLHVITGHWLDGILVPKAENASQMQAIDWMLRELETSRGMAAGSIDLMPIIESCAGLANIMQIATATPRIRRLGFGGGDFSFDMGVDLTRDEADLEVARFQMVVASRAAGLEPPCDTVFIDLEDEEGLLASVARGAHMGFGSKCCIHPQQVGAVHAGYAPSAAAVAEAREIVDAFARHEAAGSAAFRLNGKLVDYANAKRAEALLAVADGHRRAAETH